MPCFLCVGTGRSSPITRFKMLLKAKLRMAPTPNVRVWQSRRGTKRVACAMAMMMGSKLMAASMCPKRSPRGYCKKGPQQISFLEHSSGAGDSEQSGVKVRLPDSVVGHSQLREKAHLHAGQLKIHPLRCIQIALLVHG